MNTHATMERIFTHAHGLLSAGDYEGCDAMLREFDASRYHPIVAVGLLRATFAARSKLPAWDGLLARSRPRAKPRWLRGLPE